MKVSITARAKAGKPHLYYWMGRWRCYLELTRISREQVGQIIASDVMYPVNKWLDYMNRGRGYDPT